jgi:hypothetical protein
MIIFRNSIRTPDGTVLISKSRHDYQEHKDLNKEVYGIDGGNEYYHHTANITHCESLCLDTESPHRELREHFTWGTYGKCGTKPLKRVLLKDLTNEHIEAIILTQLHLPIEMLSLFGDELIYRDDFNLNNHEGEI